MLRSSRSKPYSKWPSADMSPECALSKDLESSGFSQNFGRPSRSKFTFRHPGLPILKTVLFVSTLLFFMISFFRPKTDVEWGNKARQGASRGRQDHAATRDVLSNLTSAPLGKPLQVSSLSNPPRIDRVKLLARLAKLETLFPDDDLNEDIDAVADDIRQTYGLSRWPPLISHVPGNQGHHHEEYSTETADMLFCSSTPCKILLPVWVRPVSPGRQISQIYRLMELAKLLNRTLVLPNVGEANGDAGEVLAGIGTCQRHPFAQYFDASKLLLAQDPSPKSVVPMQPFSEWVKYRPVHPTAQIVIVDLSPSNDTHDSFLAIRGAEIRIDGQVEKGRGRHKNCLSSKASKVNFGVRPAFVISPGANSTMDFPATLDNDDASTDETRASDESSYTEGIISFLNGMTGASDETLCDAGRSSSCSIQTEPLDIGNPDVLVLEWDLHPVESFFEPSYTGETNGGLLFDYSPRLYALAARILAGLERPLFILRSRSCSSINASDCSLFTDQSSRDNVASGLDEALRAIRPTPLVNSVYEESVSSHEEVTATVSVGDSNMDKALTRDKLISVKKLGTVWLNRDCARGDRSLSSSTMSSDPSVSNPEGTWELPMIGSLSKELPLPDNDLLKGFSIIDLPSALSALNLQSSRGLAGLGRHGILQDELTRVMLEDIIQNHADRVVYVGS